MSDEMLSQEEIDKLLKELTSGGSGDDGQEGGPKVKNYDFRTADRFTKDQVKTLQNIYSTFSHLFSNYLSGTLRTMCTVDVLMAEELTYSEYTNSLQPPLIMAIVDMPPLDGSTLITMTSNVAYGIINRLLGGRGGEIETSKNFTDIDIALIEKVLYQMLKLIDDSWSRVVPVKSTLNRIETSTQFAQIVSYSEPSVIITTNVKIGDEVDGFVNICLPLCAIDPISERMETSMWVSSKKIVHEEENEEEIRKRLLNSKFDMVATFNEMSITLNDFLALEPGDVIALNHRVDDALHINVAGLHKFDGKIGTYENKYAIKITDKIEEDRDDG